MKFPDLFQYLLLTKLIKVGLSTSRKICVICLIKGPLKMIENVFLFHLKSSLGSQDVKLFVTTFWSCRKNGLIRKIRSTSKFMTCHRNLVYKQLQYKYCPISHKVKVTRQWDLKVYCNCFLINTWPKSEDKILHTLRTKRAFEVK